MNKTHREEKQKMKKVLSVILIAIMLSATFVGCSKKIVYVKETTDATGNAGGSGESTGGSESTADTTEKPADTTGSNGGVGLIVDPNAGDYVAPETTEAAPGIAIPGWGELTIPPNQAEDIVVDFYNPEANDGYYYLTFKLYIVEEDGTEDVLYQSNLIPPGKHIQKVNFSHALEEGEYEAVMHVQPYKMDGTLASTNNLDAKLKLKVIGQ